MASTSTGVTVGSVTRTTGAAFVFDKVGDDEIVTGARHPRGNTDWPKIGIFAQRGKNRPNRIGSTICRIVNELPSCHCVTSSPGEEERSLRAAVRARHEGDSS